MHDFTAVHVGGNLFFYYYHCQQLAEHYRVSSFHLTVFSVKTRNQQKFSQCLLHVKCSKKIRSFSGNAVVQDAFLLCCFFYLSLTHAPIIHSSINALDVVNATEYMMHRCCTIYDERDEFCPFCLHAVCGQTKTNYSDSGRTYPTSYNLLLRQQHGRLNKP